MEMQKSGGPVHPTLNGRQIDESTFQFEGMTLFDYYVGQFIVAGIAPAEAVKNAVKVMDYRNKHLIGEKK
jgi:hypothetical protein